MPNHCDGRCSGVEKLIAQIHVSWGREEERREAYRKDAATLDTRTLERTATRIRRLEGVSTILRPHNEHPASRLAMLIPAQPGTGHFAQE